MTKAFDLDGSREKGKITKVAESKLVLDAEFLFTPFTLYLVLTAHVFCVALHQSKIPNGWLVDRFYRSIKPETNSIWRLKIFCDTFTKSSEALKICLKNMFKCTNADLKICQYFRLHIKIICWRFHIKTSFTFWDMLTWDMCKDFLQSKTIEYVKN